MTQLSPEALELTVGVVHAEVLEARAWLTEAETNVERAVGLADKARIQRQEAAERVGHALEALGYFQDLQAAQSPADDVEAEVEA